MSRPSRQCRWPIPAPPKRSRLSRGTLNEHYIAWQHTDHRGGQQRIGNGHAGSKARHDRDDRHHTGVPAAAGEDQHGAAGLQCRADHQRIIGHRTVHAADRPEHAAAGGGEDRNNRSGRGRRQGCKEGREGPTGRQGPGRHPQGPGRRARRLYRQDRKHRHGCQESLRQSVHGRRRSVEELRDHRQVQVQGTGPVHPVRPQDDRRTAGTGLGGRGRSPA